ncbi:hypothetical protein C8R43DRAFT_311800 [Mycena crocata]|nr:hypothetical protein C8R43DRAFT_311800 [Mycena crocata]
MNARSTSSNFISIVTISSRIGILYLIRIQLPAMKLSKLCQPTLFAAQDPHSDLSPPPLNLTRGSTAVLLRLRFVVFLCAISFLLQTTPC